MAAKGKAPFPGFIPPALATKVNQPPPGNDWLHEIKFDGYRAQVHIAHETIRVLTRRGTDWTRQFKAIADKAWLIKAKSAIIDGEIVVQASSGLTDFSLLQSAIRSKKPSDKLVMYAFDLLYLNGTDLRRLPLVARKRELERLIQGTGILFSEDFDTDGATVLKQACAMGLEGIVSKRRNDTYHSDRTDSWRKLTCRTRETLFVTGYSLKENRFDGLYLGRLETDGLKYAGKVEHGFDRNNEREILTALKPLQQREQPYAVNPKKPKAIWAKPVLLAEVEYRGMTTTGKLRHPSFKGLREDL